MVDNTRPRVLLFGAGGVGTVYLWLLSKTSTTTAVCRSNYDVAKRDGFIINSSIFGHNIHFRPNVVQSCQEAASADPMPFDYIVVCSKAIPSTVPTWIAPAVTPGHTAIVLLQNGIGIEEEYRTAFPSNPIISTVLYFPATQRPAGVITHGEIERLEMGAYPSSAPDTHAKAFARLVTSAGATAILHTDIQQIRWTKLLINASWNPICALALSKDTDVLQSSPGAVHIIEAVMLEIRDIAAAHGHDITLEKVQFELGRAKARIPINAGIEPSMLQDVLSERRIEVEAIIGNPVRMGKAKGVRCDRLELLYVLAKTLDLHLGKKMES
jgi:2-dehydropantoate 2-reductase